MPLPKVSVIIINWNRFADVAENLEFLRKQNYPNFEVIIADNGSTDGSVERLKEMTGVRTIFLGENLGPAAARNRAMDVAEGTYHIFLDSDAVFIDPSSISRLVERMEKDPQIGLLGCKILNYFSKEIDQWIYGPARKNYHNEEFETYSFSAAGAIVRASAIQKCGGFWEKLFIYHEEAELSIRLIKNKYKVLYYPHVVAHHKESPEGRVHSSFYYTLLIRNWIWIFRRHYPSWHCWKKTLLYSGVYVVKGVANRKLWACITGIRNGITNSLQGEELEKKLSPAEITHLNRLNRKFF